MGTGFDLGQHDAADLRRLGIDRRLVAVLEPYLRRQGQGAQALLERQPLDLSPGEVTALDRAKRLDTARKIERGYSTPSIILELFGNHVQAAFAWQCLLGIFQGDFTSRD